AEGWSATAGIRTFVVLDEAWKVASDERSDAVTIIREGRKYQFGLIVASQNPTDVNEAIFSNVGTTFMLRIRFEKFMNYLQGSLNFSDYIRGEISKLGVGEAAVDMAFNTSVRFPNVFMINKIVGELPLDTYMISLLRVLTPQELDDASVQKDCSFDKNGLSSKLINSGVGSDVILKVLAKLGDQGNSVDVVEFTEMLMKEGASRESAVNVLRSMEIKDPMIAKVFSYVNKG
ncbi:MAG: hypothetical protein M1321_00915, partial [Candidatus Marsarchaeota archaeon]|nr:hypothetical protein [Candidatus Marsarchaeota archaeon]